MILKWNYLVAKRNKIYKPRDDFESIINGMLSNKELHFLMKESIR
jgi:hypothetical protein